MSQTDCSPRANGLLAPSHRIVRPGPADCPPRPAGRPDNPPASQAIFFWKRGTEIRGSGTDSRNSTNSYPRTHYFFWKWEGDFAAQEQNVQFHDFHQNFFNSVSENLPRNAIYTFRAISGFEKILSNRGSQTSRSA